MSFDRGAKSAVRLRREFQQLGIGEGGLAYGSGLLYDPAAGTLSVDIVTPNGGLEFVANELQVDLAAGSPLTLTGGLDLDWTQREWDVTVVQTTQFTAGIGEVARCDPSGGGFTVDLPTAVGIAGKEIIVKNVTGSTNTITVDPSGTQTIDGSTTVTITTGYGRLHIVSDGANWMEVT